jgi:hypothetical protein
VAQALTAELREPRTETELRGMTFAEQVLLTVEVGTAYRNVFAPGEDVSAAHRAAGARLMKDSYVGMWIGHLATHALAAAGVQREHAIRRLLETIEADLTDYVYTDGDKKGEFMDLATIRETLPLAKRRLIRKVTPSGDIELEPKQPALELLARIEQLVQPNQVNVQNNIIAEVAGQSKDQLRAEILRRMSNPELVRSLLESGTLPEPLVGMLTRVVSEQ